MGFPSGPKGRGVGNKKGVLYDSALTFVRRREFSKRELQIRASS